MSDRLEKIRKAEYECLLWIEHLLPIARTPFHQAEAGGEALFAELEALPAVLGSTHVERRAVETIVNLASPIGHAGQKEIDHALQGVADYQSFLSLLEMKHHHDALGNCCRAALMAAMLHDSRTKPELFQSFRAHRMELWTHIRDSAKTYNSRLVPQYFEEYRECHGLKAEYHTGKSAIEMRIPFTEPDQMFHGLQHVLEGCLHIFEEPIPDRFLPHYGRLRDLVLQYFAGDSLDARDLMEALVTAEQAGPPTLELSPKERIGSGHWYGVTHLAPTFITYATFGDMKETPSCGWDRFNMQMYEGLQGGYPRVTAAHEALTTIERINELADTLLKNDRRA